MLVIGLISGTSVDGIDAALVEITGETLDLEVKLLAGATYPYPGALRSQILDVIAGKALTMMELAALDDAIAYQFAQATLALQTAQPSAELIGSHGQTVYHQPPGKSVDDWTNRLGDLISPSTEILNLSPLAYSLQMGRGAAIAHLTGVTTVSNFRAADIAMGGQGAPLVPPVDACLLTHPAKTRCIQNLGGIGNVAYLPARDKSNSSQASNHPAILGWDTGPANTLLDLAAQHLSHGEKTYDHDGAWAATGVPHQELVQEWLQQPFFQQPPPKSTGREEFGIDYLHRCLRDTAVYELADADILATLTELTAASIARSYRTFLPQMPDQVLLCGGGSRNNYLKQRIQANLGSTPVCTTDEVGLNADFKEAIAFAVLAYWRLHEIPGNLPEVTGASMGVPLGEIHRAA